ncbi:HK97 family phage prohead protease [Capnocytophaga canimorsus]|uniref:HK97 family phage prohead protease n=1 Tax=Capnocytophaga canimorsus TaxID=28188 RepID=UPI0037D8B725
MNKKVFVLNDETQTNSYGFRVKTEGISLARFESNPVCLNNHKNDTKNVLGKWVNILKNGTRLTASPEFDTEDTDGKEVVRKVEKGILKACSIGIMFKPEDVKLIDGVPVVEKCELMEASIVAVPSNAQAITLYNDKGEALTHDEAKTFCLSFQSNTKNQNTMNKEILALLKLEDNANEDAVKEAVKAIVANLLAVTSERDTLKTKLATIEAQEQQKLQAEFNVELEKAVKDGRLDANNKTPIEEIAKTNTAQAIAVLKAIPVRETVADKLKTETSALAKYDQLSWDELDKGGHLPYLKLNHKAYYVERFKEEFGKEPN